MPEKDKDKSPKNVSDTDTLRKKAKLVKEVPTGSEWEKVTVDGEELYVKRAQRDTIPAERVRDLPPPPPEKPKTTTDKKNKYKGPPPNKPKPKPKPEPEPEEIPPTESGEEEVVMLEPKPKPKQTGMFGSARAYRKIVPEASTENYQVYDYPDEFGNYTNKAVRKSAVGNEVIDIAKSYDAKGNFKPFFTGEKLPDPQIQQITTAGFDDVVDERNPNYKGSLMMPGTKVTRMTGGGGGEFNQRNVEIAPNALKGAGLGYIEQKYDAQGNPIITPNQGVQFNEENLKPLRVGEMEVGKMYDIPNTTTTVVPKQNRAKGGKIMAPKVMKKYAMGGDIAGYNYQGQPVDRYGKVIEEEGMTTEDVGKSALDILSNAASKLAGSKTTTTTSNTGNKSVTANTTSTDANATAQSGSTESGGLVGKLGGKSALIGVATDLGVAGAGLGASYIDSKSKDPRGRYKNVESAVGSSALKGAAFGAKIGTNPALMTATGGLSAVAAPILFGVGGGIYGGVKGQKDVAAIKESKTKMANELSQANAKRKQERALANREAGILEGNQADLLTTGEAIYDENDNLINAREGGVIGSAKMRYAKGGTIVGKGGPKDDAIFTKANEKGIAPGSFIVPAENEEKAKGIRAALFGNRNQKAQFKKGGETESNVAVSNGEHLFTPKERKKIINYLGEEILEELAPNAEENNEEKEMAMAANGGMLGNMTDRTNMREYVKGGLMKRADGSYSKRGLWDNIRDAAGSNKAPTAEMLKQEKKIKAEYYNGGMIPESVASQKRTEQIQDSYAGGGYVVEASSDREGKTHKVTGPDGTVKYFGDANLGQHPKDPERKKAFYARHADNLKKNPFFRAYAKETWAEGGTTGDGLSKSKAKIMLHEGMVHGKPITEQQRKYFGWVAGGSKQSKMDGGDIRGYAMGTDVEGVDGEPQSNKTYAELITPPKSFGGSKESWKAAVDKSIKEGKTIPKGGVATASTTKSIAAPSVKKGTPKSKDMTPETMERKNVALEELRKMDEAQALKLQQAGEKSIMAKPIIGANVTTPSSPSAPRKGLADYVSRIDPGAAFSAYQIMQGSKLLKSGERPKDVSAIDPAWNAAVERAQREATFGYTPEQAAMLDQKAINALNDARFSGRNLAGGSAGTAFQQERQAINQGWANALQLKSADQQLRMQKQQYADQAVKERADFLDMQRRRAFGDAMDTYNVNQESGSALVGAGVRNAIGAFRYQKELEAQERAAKIAGTPIKTT